MPHRRLRFEPLEDRTNPAVFTVTTLADAGPGSLRDALAQANAAPDADTIVFDPAVRGGIVAVSTFDNRSASTADDPQPVGPTAFVITTPVTVAGTGETINRAAGSAAFRLFQVTAGGNLILENLTLSNGFAQGGAGGTGGGGAGLGGAVYNQGLLTITGCTLVGNQAVGGATTGGGGRGDGGGGLGGPASGSTGGPPDGGLVAANGGFGGGGGGSLSSSAAAGSGGFGGGGGASTAGSAVSLTAPLAGVGGFGGGGGGGGFFLTSDGPVFGFGGVGGFGGAKGGIGRVSGNDILIGTGGGGGGMGGAVFNQGGTVSIVNSTLTANAAVGGSRGTFESGLGLGGAVFNLNGSVTLANVTVAGNAVGGASTGGGAVYNLSLAAPASPGGPPATPAQTATLTMTNSILAGSVGGPDLTNRRVDGVAAAVTAGGPNIVAVSDNFIGGTVSGTPFTVADPHLGPLQNNGGLTATMALLSGSPAIGAGDNAGVPAGVTTDQRGPGFPRIVNGAVDLGAFEVQLPVPVLAGGPAGGSARVLTPSSGQLQPGATVTFFPGFAGNVRVAVADVNGDGVPDYVGGAGPGGGPRVVVLDGKTGAVVADFFAFEPTFTGGVFVAAADIDGDVKAEVVVTPDQGGGPVVAVYSGAKLAAGLTGDAAQLARFFGIEDPNFRGGARPALGDVNGDKTPDLVVSAGFLGGPRIAVFDGRSVAAGASPPVKLLPDFFAFEPTLRNGAFVAAGDVTGDGFADLAFGGGPGGAPRVRVFSGQGLLAAGGFASLDDVPTAQLANFFAGDASLRGGVRVALKDAEGDGKAALVTGSGEGEPSRVRVFKSATVLAGSATPDQELDPFGAVLADGVFVG
jgi:hypothetical protein